MTRRPLPFLVEINGTPLAGRHKPASAAEAVQIAQRQWQGLRAAGECQTSVGAYAPDGTVLFLNGWQPPQHGRGLP